MTLQADRASDAMFKITPGMEQAWLAMGKPKATLQDIAQIERELGIRLPADYVDFVTRYGFVVFGRDDERRWQFSYLIERGGRKQTRQRGISYLFTPQKMLTIHRYMISLEDPDDETRPMIPPGFLPIGSDSGHARLLLDIAANPGQVWFWPQSDWRWGTEDNLALGFVADNFADFINNLSPDTP
ncbi:MAG: SMI1/KNR4 family protein [Betaproteobacteria bacterium]